MAGWQAGAPAAAVVQLLQGDLEAVHHVLAPALALRAAPAAAAKQVKNVCHAAAAAAASALLRCVFAKLWASHVVGSAACPTVPWDVCCVCMQSSGTSRKRAIHGSGDSANSCVPPLLASNDSS